MNWLDFVVLTLAASAIVDVWKNGSIFADWRAFFENDSESQLSVTPAAQATDTTPEEWVSEFVKYEPDNLPLLMRFADRWVPQFVAEILGCSFCLSHHTPWIVGVVFFLPALVLPYAWLVFLLKLPAYSLAATRLGNIINSYAPQEAKYDK